MGLHDAGRFLYVYEEMYVAAGSGLEEGSLQTGTCLTKASKPYQ